MANFVPKRRSSRQQWQPDVRLTILEGRFEGRLRAPQYGASFAFLGGVEEISHADGAVMPELPFIKGRVGGIFVGIVEMRRSLQAMRLSFSDLSELNGLLFRFKVARNHKQGNKLEAIEINPAGRYAYHVLGDLQRTLQRL